MHPNWFHGVELVHGRWQHGGVEYWCPSRLERTICKWDMYVPLDTEGLTVYYSISFLFLSLIVDIKHVHSGFESQKVFQPKLIPLIRRNAS
jgi:hypothetical protein